MRQRPFLLLCWLGRTMRWGSNSCVKLGEHQARMKTARRVPGPNKSHHTIENKYFNWGTYYIVPYYVGQHSYNIVLRIGESLCLFLNLGPCGAWLSYPPRSGKEHSIAQSWFRMSLMLLRGAGVSQK